MIGEHLCANTGFPQPNHKVAYCKDQCQTPFLLFSAAQDEG